ncbi:MAG TPA: hypothetical protein VGD14_25135 [bacterium]
MVDATSGAFNWLAPQFVRGKWQAIFGKTQFYTPQGWGIGPTDNLW